jgi:hypothetical protein
MAKVRPSRSGSTVVDMRSLPGYQLGRSLDEAGAWWAAREDATGDPVALRWVRKHGPCESGSRESGPRESGPLLVADPYPVDRVICLLVRFEHPAAVRVRAVLDAGEEWVGVTDPVRVRSLAALLDERFTLRPGEVVSLVRAISSPLAAAYRAGLCPGSLSVDDVLVTDEPDPLLLDLTATCLLAAPAPAVADADLRGTRDLAALAAVALTGGPPPLLPAGLPDERGRLAATVLQRWAERAHRYGVPAPLVGAVCQALSSGPGHNLALPEWAERVRRSCPAEPISRSPRGWATWPDSDHRRDGDHVDPDDEHGSADCDHCSVVADHGSVDAEAEGGSDAEATSETAAAVVGDVLVDVTPREDPGEASRRPRATHRNPGRDPRFRVAELPPVVKAAAVVGLVFLAAALVVFGLAGRSGSAATVGADPAAPDTPATGAPATSAPPPGSALPGSATAPTVSPAPTMSPAEPTVGTNPGVADQAEWRRLIIALDDRRRVAFEVDDVTTLSEVYLPGAAQLAADVADLAALRAVGATAVGVRHEIAAVEIVSAGSSRAILMVTDRLTGYRIVRGPVVLKTIAATPPRRIAMELHRTGAGWRIAEITDAGEP